MAPAAMRIIMAPGAENQAAVSRAARLVSREIFLAAVR